MLHRFQQPISTLELPTQFTFPFQYEAHPLAVVASEQLQKYLAEYIPTQPSIAEQQNKRGKMFGVLVVSDQKNELGFLAAFSGKLGDFNTHEYFVPPIFDMLAPNSFFIKGERAIATISQQIRTLKTGNDRAQLIEQKTSALKEIEQQFKSVKQTLKQRKQNRKLQRATSNEVENLEKLNHESRADHFILKDAKETRLKAEANAILPLKEFDQNIKALERKRADMSNQLQQQLFEMYNMRNAQHEILNVKEIFAAFNGLEPPSATGECAAPKLLQFAYENQLKPICMAEFWYGPSPKTQVRKHGVFYPSCKHKCEPLLDFMLRGLDVEASPILIKASKPVDELETVYEDEDLIIVNKPINLLSTPGRRIKQSVQSILKAQNEDIALVHRLDMSTSGLLIATKNHEAYVHLQKQFTARTVKKKYVAVLDGIPKNDSGIINLPLKPDFINRPQQMVCYNSGKTAITKYEVIEKLDNQCKVHFYPETGRSHQLRVHAAHQDGLNCPIVGDDIYGTTGERLHLHAVEITFEHPRTNDSVHFMLEDPF